MNYKYPQQQHPFSHEDRFLFYCQFYFYEKSVIYNFESIEM